MGTAGWVRFEPTPGAPTVRTPSYTRQANAGLPNGVPTAAASPGRHRGPGRRVGQAPRRRRRRCRGRGRPASRDPWPWLAGLAARRPAAGPARAGAVGAPPASAGRRARAGVPGACGRRAGPGRRDGRPGHGSGDDGGDRRGLRVPEEQTAAGRAQACAERGAPDVGPERSASPRPGRGRCPGWSRPRSSTSARRSWRSALGRICAAVEAQRYAPPAGRGARRRLALPGRGDAGASAERACSAGGAGAGAPGRARGRSGQPVGPAQVAAPAIALRRSGHRALAQDVARDARFGRRRPAGGGCSARVAPISLLADAGASPGADRPPARTPGGRPACRG